MDTTSLWQAISTRTTRYPALHENLSVDVAIIGGGITGITAAAELIAKGKQVAILEADKIGGVTTGASTGNLYVAVQPFYQNIYSKFDLETAKTIAQSRIAAIDYIEKNIQEKNIKCDFKRRPWYAYTNKDPRISLDKEVELFKKMAVPVDYIDELPLPFKFKRAIVMQNQARFNPLQYVISMGDDLAKQGCHIFEDTRVLQFDENKNVCTIKTEHGLVTAKQIILATHTPIGINPTQVFTAPYRSYVVAIHLHDKKYPEGHFWDLDRPPHATCTHAENSNHPSIMAVAGSHHKTGQGKHMDMHFHEMEKFLRDHLDVSDVVYRWSAQHYQSADNVPYIGLASRFSKHIYMATGYFADGLVYGTVAGVVLAGLISHKKNQLDEVYRSTRLKPLASLPFLMKEDSNMFLQYLKDFPLHSHHYDDLRIGDGKVVEINREKCAVSRDEENRLHIVSAVCTHMKCIVNWNDAEKSWDCPCHGSRFKPDGTVIEGPAIENLAKKNPRE